MTTLRNTLVLAYRDCILFEVIPAAQRLESKFPVRVATPVGHAIRDDSGLTILADFAYNDVDPLEYACVLIPGGNPDRIADDSHITRIIRGVIASGGIAAGICAGVAVLGLAGALVGRRIAHNYTADDVPAEVRVHTDPLWRDTTYAPEGISRDARVITARPERHIEFADAVADAVREAFPTQLAPAAQRAGHPPVGRRVS